MRPRVGGYRRRSVRRALERVVGAIGAPVLDRADFAADGDHRVDEAIELGLRLGFGRLDHQRAGDREAHRRRVEAVIDQTLRDVVDRDVRDFLERAQIQYAFVRDSPVWPRIQHRIERIEARCDVIRGQDRALGRGGEAGRDVRLGSAATRAASRLAPSIRYTVSSKRSTSTGATTLPFSTQNVAKRVMPVIRHAGRSE